jgi:hypothetical protein
MPTRSLLASAGLLPFRVSLQELRTRYGDDEVIGFSTVTLVEFAHDVARAKPKPSAGAGSCSWTNWSGTSLPIR